MGKIKKLELTEAQRVQLEKGFCNGVSHCLRMLCRAVLLKADDLSSAKAEGANGYEFSVRECMDETLPFGKHYRSANTSGPWP
jgi:hypothetical protein